MHQYSNSKTLGPFFYLVLSALSVVCAWLLSLFLKNIKLGSLLLWIDLPSVLGFFGILWTWFDQIGWRKMPLRKLFRIDVPNLSGNWLTLAEPNQELGKRAEGKATIKQTWSEVKIIIDWKDSKSTSFAATLLKADDQFELNYQFMNIPKPLATRTMNVHKGTAQLALSADHSKLVGEYYSGKGRNNDGQLTLVRATTEKQ